uniref:Uncharacterized protein n=1 Tax=Romanomermis culicivorax TaxID=13658 RepID=A0A915J6P5_ROMCU
MDQNIEATKFSDNEHHLQQRKTVRIDPVPENMPTHSLQINGSNSGPQTPLLVSSSDVFTK